MDDDVKSLIRRRESEVARELIERRLVDYVLMSAGLISAPQPLLADVVWHIQDVKLMCDVGLDYQGPHPSTPANGVGGEIENDRKLPAQDVDDMRSNGIAQSRR